MYRERVTTLFLYAGALGMVFMFGGIAVMTACKFPLVLENAGTFTLIGCALFLVAYFALAHIAK